MTTYADYINALKSPAQHPVFKLEFLDSNENVIDSITPDILDGTLTLDLGSGSGSRRSCNLLLKNTEGEYIPSENYLWMNSRFRLYTGLKINNEDYLVSRGIFCLSNPTINSFFSEKTANLMLLDKWALLDGTLAGTLDSDYIIPVSTNIEDAVRGIFQEAGEVKTPIIYPTTEITPYTIVKEAGGTYADILVDLANMLSWEVFYDSNGYPRFQPPTDKDKSTSVWNFTVDEILYLGSSHTYDFSKVKNYIKVIGDNINGQIISAVAQDTNISSPTRVDLIGKRTQVIIDNLIYSTALAQARADYELQKAIAMYESVDITCMPIDIINEGSIITITDTDNGLLNADRFLVQSVNFPLRYDGEMKLSVWKARSLS